MISLTAQQLRMLRFITGHVAARGTAPTMEQCKAAAGLATRSGAHRVVRRLEERGAIQRLSSQPRDLAVIEPVPVPMAGNVPLYAVPVIAGPVLRFSGERL
jgi:SOS-response transcriptional repressor LexA